MAGRRIKKGPRQKFVKLDEWFLKSPAWASLDPDARCAYIELARLYNGRNNGELGMSCRRLGVLLNVSKNRANRVIQKLIERGFISVTRNAGFGWKAGARQRLAPCYALTQFPVGNAIATKKFVHWSPSPAPPLPTVSERLDNIIALRCGKAA